MHHFLPYFPFYFNKYVKMFIKCGHQYLSLLFKLTVRITIILLYIQTSNESRKGLWNGYEIKDLLVFLCFIYSTSKTCMCVLILRNNFFIFICQYIENLNVTYFRQAPLLLDITDNIIYFCYFFLVSFPFPFSFQNDNLQFIFLFQITFHAAACCVLLKCCLILFFLFLTFQCTFHLKG